ncbi:MAG: hypothetical protein QUV08_12430 [Parasphingorhabdus sp.]|nr:hypothetical protein [Parasphingorhabdus sp.]
MSVVSAEQLVIWANREAAQTTGPARPYRGRYPDLSGPTMQHAGAVDLLARELKKAVGVLGHE